MLFRCVVQRHAKRNAWNATLARAFVALARHVRRRRQGCDARAARWPGAFLPAWHALVIKISYMAKRKILFFQGI
jgi:hypothetical protein